MRGWWLLRGERTTSSSSVPRRWLPTSTRTWAADARPERGAPAMSVEDRLAIQEAMARYAHAYDGGDAAAFADVFTDDGVFEIVLPDGDLAVRLRAHDEIVDWASRRLLERRGRFTSRHHQSGILFDELTSTSATTRTTVLVTHHHAGEPAPRLTTTGVYRD